jgi:hypothetical protein
MAGVTIRDLGKVQWAPTLKLALGRSIASGLVITLLMGLSGGYQNLAALMGFFLSWGLTSFIGAPMTALMIRGLNMVFAGMGLGIAVLAGNIILSMLALLVACGDPIIYFLNRRFPGLFDVADFKVFNLQLTIFVLPDTTSLFSTGKEDFA